MTFSWPRSDLVPPWVRTGFTSAGWAPLRGRGWWWRDPSGNSVPGSAPYGWGCSALHPSPSSPWTSLYSDSPATSTLWTKTTLWRITSWHLTWRSVSLASPQWPQAKRWHRPRSPTSSVWSCTSPSSTSSSGAPLWGLWVRACFWMRLSLPPSHLCSAPTACCHLHRWPLFWGWPLSPLCLWA